MHRILTKVGLALGCMACAAPQRAAPLGSTPANQMVGAFIGPQGRIQINPSQLTISVAENTYPLVDCSNTEFRCLKNAELGFHVVFVRSCDRRPTIEGEAVGGALFYQFAGSEHGDERNGRYRSEQSDRFAYGYSIDRGLVEIQYDPTGVTRFNPRLASQDRHGYAAWQPFTYRLAPGQTFLRCTELR